jgi:hypothetical protein
LSDTAGSSIAFATAFIGCFTKEIEVEYYSDFNVYLTAQGGLVAVLPSEGLSLRTHRIKKRTDYLHNRSYIWCAVSNGLHSTR